MELINSTFQANTAQKILQIPLAESNHEDTQAWKGELSGEFSVRSAYKLLQDATLDPSNYLLHAETKKIYRKLWNLQLSSKISITIWRISWEFIPNLVNLKHRRVIADDRCLRCHAWAEDSLHIFRQCPTTIEVLQLLNLSWIMENTNQSLWENQIMHERKNTTGRELAQNIRRHMAEYEGAKVLQFPGNINRYYRSKEDIPRVTIQFDAAFDSRNYKSATGLVVWGLRGELLVSKTIIHNIIPSPFAAEAYVCLEGTKLGILMGVRSIKITGDSKTTIRKCQMTTTDKSVIGAIIKDI
ncbi:hypothetical protein CXB51_029003 [Gossypium anomalum]|uniref:Reverse transcriptase zinc-binding domain-containing protein n=1 Tax=Gossypium anomalum TaxID=47600 RepID=A0A8J5YLE6_9ROSI|nr:hypothetical protein CXB51_029003 [Gossypium anomalum]